MKETFNGFKQFILRGNVVDLAVGVVIGSAFTAIVNALVTDILTPFIGMIAKIPDMTNFTFTVRGSTFAYGHFFNAVITFVLVAVAVYFFVITPINRFFHKEKNSSKPSDPTTKKCPECLSEIPIAAKKCAHCTSVLQG
jgi:large conductance mechanosensitive channel